MNSPLDTLNEPARSALVALAGAATNASASCVPIPDGHDADAFEPAFEAGFVEPCDGGFVFTDDEAHAQALTEAFLPEAEAAWEDPPAVVALLHRVWRLQHRGLKGVATPGRLHPTARILLALARGGRNVAARIPDLIAADYPGPGEVPDDDPPGGLQQRKTAVKLAVTGALSDLDPTPHRVLEVGVAAGAYFEDTGGVGFNYMGLGATARDHPDTAIEAVRLALEADTPQSLAAIPHLLHGLAAAAPDDAMDRALALTRETESARVHTGLLALGGLYFPAGDSRYDIVLDRLDEMTAGPAPEVERALARALAAVSLRSHVERALDLLVRLAPRRNAATAVARGVADLAVHYGPDLYRTALLRLARAPLSGGGLEAFRSALYQAPPDLALDAAEAWALSHLPGEVGFADAVNYALDNVPDDALDARVTRWFASGSPALSRAAADLVNDARRMSRPWAFPPLTVATLDAREILHAARQVLGWLHNGRALARLVVSLFDAPTLPPEVAAFVEDRLVDFVAFTRPGETREILSSIDASRRPRAAAVAARVLARVDAQDERHQALERRTELMVPLDRIRPFIVARRRFDRGIYKSVQAQSDFPLKDLFHEVQVRGGKGSLVEMHDGTLEVSPFQKIETPGFSLRGDAIDPVGQDFRRLVWRATPLPEPDPVPLRPPNLPSGGRGGDGRRQYPTRVHPKRRKPFRRTPRR